MTGETASDRFSRRSKALFARPDGTKIAKATILGNDLFLSIANVSPCSPDQRPTRHYASALQENLSSASVWSLRLSIAIRVAKRPACSRSEPSILCRKDSQGAPGALAGEALF